MVRETLASLASKGDVYVAPTGQVVPALVRVRADNRIDIVDAFPSGQTSLAEKLANQIKDPVPDADNMTCEAVIDALSIRSELFPAVKGPDPADADEPDGPKQVLHAQMGFVTGGQEVVVGYAKLGALPSMRVLLKNPLALGNNSPGLLRVQSINQAVKSGLLKPDCRRKITLEVASPTDEDAWLYALDFGRSDAKSWNQRVSAFLLDAQHKRDPLVADAGSYQVAGGVTMTASNFRRFYYEDLQRFRSSELVKKPCALAFDKSSARFAVFEQRDVELKGDVTLTGKQLPRVSLCAEHFITLCDGIRHVARGELVEISTNGKGLLRMAVDNALGRYEFFSPTIPTNKKEPTAEGYRLASAIYGTSPSD